MCFQHRLFLTVYVCVNYANRNTLVSVSLYNCVYWEAFTGLKGGQHRQVSMHRLDFVESTGVRWDKYRTETAEMDISFISLGLILCFGCKGSIC